MNVTIRIMNNLNAFINVKDANGDPADYIQYRPTSKKRVEQDCCREVELGNHIHTYYNERCVAINKSQLSMLTIKCVNLHQLLCKFHPMK